MDIYFRNLLNEENPRTLYESGEANEGVVQDISREEMESVLRKMKMGKAIGTDWILVEAWRSLGKEGIDIILDLMKKPWQQEKIPDEWRKSILVPIFKGKGDKGLGRNLRLERNSLAFCQEGVRLMLSLHKTADGKAQGNAGRFAHGVHRSRKDI
ncbi:uncharacterized protein [Centruroides vittatus]|uniref:uncharacterized protein n=1 Tax=Centruroides vittatus TaxID=120091 RepID=UPI00350F30F0